MRWITSAGGPLVLVPRAAVGQWRGVADGGADYGAACEVSDYTGVIRWFGADILVLNDEPLSTACVTQDGTVALIRWMYAPNESAILAAIRTGWAELPPPVETSALTCTEGPYVLFDSGAVGREVTDGLAIEIPHGTYRVNTHVWKPSDGVGIIVHLFVRQAV